MSSSTGVRDLTVPEQARDLAVVAGRQFMSGLEWWLLRSLPNFQDILRDVATISRDDRWKTFFFTAYGYRSDASYASCPRTGALLDAIPRLVTAFFSILSPGKRIPAHRGPYRGVVRCHLGVIVPSPPAACGISVGGEERHWREGETMFFDDGYEHFAWNDSGETRVVLFLDVIRPLRQPAAAVNKTLLRAISSSPFLRDAKRRHQAGNAASTAWRGERGAGPGGLRLAHAAWRQASASAT
jgi:ornithine lipid ester-linked acyl 2-hydroxylase